MPIVRMTQERDGTFSVYGPGGERHKAGDQAQADQIMEELIDKILGSMEQQVTACPDHVPPCAPEDGCAVCGVRYRCTDDPLLCGTEATDGAAPAGMPEMDYLDYMGGESHGSQHAAV